MDFPSEDEQKDMDCNTLDNDILLNKYFYTTINGNILFNGIKTDSIFKILKIIPISKYRNGSQVHCYTITIADISASGLQYKICMPDSFNKALNMVKTPTYIRFLAEEWHNNTGYELM